MMKYECRQAQYGPTSGLHLQLVPQQRVESSRRRVVRLVLQDQPAVLQRLQVLATHYCGEELRIKDTDVKILLFEIKLHG